MTKEKILEILKGIDQEETESADGWWETSVGAEFGKRKLDELLAELEKEEKSDEQPNRN